MYDKVGDPKVSMEYTNEDSTRLKMIMFQKQTNGHYYVVTAVPDIKDKSLQAVSTYIEKPGTKKAVDQLVDISRIPSSHAHDAVGATAIDNSVAPIERTVNDAGVKKQRTKWEMY